MVGEVRLRGVRVVAEAHKGTRAAAPAAGGGRRLVELSHVITAGMTTYPGLPGPEITPHLTRADSRGRYESGT